MNVAGLSNICNHNILDIEIICRILYKLHKREDVLIFVLTAVHTMCFSGTSFASLRTLLKSQALFNSCFHNHIIFPVFVKWPRHTRYCFTFPKET